MVIRKKALKITLQGTVGLMVVLVLPLFIFGSRAEAFAQTGIGEETESAREFRGIVAKIRENSVRLGETELVNLSEKLLFGFIKEYPDSPEASKARVAMMQVYTSLGANKKAIEQYDKLFEQGAAIAVEDRNSGRFFLGMAYLQAEEFEKAEEVFEGMRDQTAGTGSKIRMAAEEALKRLKVKKRLRVGAQAIDFPDTTRTISGKKISLDDYSGKVVLLDFWATWCAPCRQEMPNVLRIYEKYQDDGFDIIGISMDTDRERLDAFIEEFGIPWKQIFDGGGWNSNLGKLYAVAAIPSTYLLDREGKIYAKNLRGEKLESAVKKLLDK